MCESKEPSAPFGKEGEVELVTTTINTYRERASSASRVGHTGTSRGVRLGVLAMVLVTELVVNILSGERRSKEGVNTMCLGLPLRLH